MLKFGFGFQLMKYVMKFGTKTYKKKGIEYLKKLNDDFPIDHFEDFLNFHNISEEFFKVAKFVKIKNIYKA